MSICPKYFILLLLLIVTISISISGQTVGYVLEAKGNWFLSGSNKPLKSFDKLPANGVIRLQSPKDTDSIIVVANGERISRKCSSSSCSIPIKLPNVKKGWVDSGIEILNGLNPWAKNRIILGPIISMGENLFEDVLELKDKKAEITSLTNLEGENCLRWRKVSITEKEPVGEWSKSLKLEKNKKIIIPDLEAGLYEFSLANPRENCLVNYPQSAWILVSSAEKAAKNKESFQKLKKMIDSWNSSEDDFPIREETIVSLLRAQLFVLAKQNSK